MAIDCNACTDLQEDAATFVQNGVTTAVCKSLKNNTGFNSSLSTLHDNQEDLDLANDCLIGMMASILDGYDTCDWKEFMAKFIPNLHQLLKAIICNEAGQWSNMDYLQCQIKYLFNGANFNIGESTSGDAYAVAGKGVSFLLAGSGEHEVDIALTYIAGGLMRGTGTFYFYTEDFAEPNSQQVGNFDLDDTYRVTNARKGNSRWKYPLDDGSTRVGDIGAFGELICEFRILTSAYPQIKRIFNGSGQMSAGGAYLVSSVVFVEGEYAYGQHGGCSKSTGIKSRSDYDDGHPVDDGFIYVQLRMKELIEPISCDSGNGYTPRYHMGVRMNREEIDC